MKKFSTPAKRRKQASPKAHLIRRKSDIDTENQLLEGEDQYLQIKQAIEAYFIEYAVPDKALTRPGINSSTIGGGLIFLRTGKHLLAIFQIDSGKFLPLTPANKKIFPISHDNLFR